MKFSDEVLDAIEKEANKLSLRYHAYHNGVELEHQRRRKILKTTPPKALKAPDYWKIDSKFNPFYVHKHRAAIARSISNKIMEHKYAPHEPAKREIPKPQGGTRSISVYQIPDAAISALFFQKLLRKNRHRFSSSSYAYRDDRNAHFAIQDISIDLANSSRVFIAEFDFSKFFDSISHDYLFAQLHQNGFSVSSREKHVIEAFLSSQAKGVPQGTSISLFLANLVCWKLDKNLELAGLKFARYADDTVIWSPDYSRIAQSVDIIANFSRETEVKINIEKSKGIRLLCAKEMPAEFAERTDHIEFLGYSLSANKIGIKERSTLKIKRQINYILYQHLIQPLRGPKLQAVTIPSAGRDRDLMAALGSVRRYLYGNLNDEYIRRYLSGSSGRIFYKGVMSFYPLLSDKLQMQELDGWLVNQVWKGLRMRERLLKKWGYNRSYMFPFNVSRKEFAAALRAEKVGKRRLYAIPSFVVIYLALRKAVSEEGVVKLLSRDEY
ncbi:reverse transcriptase domain-containing protein [Lysobacter sp. CCNWLW3]|uniref:reverse transcriptase domain-containing protein n=1 Tax=unclassified Lysobacter TaxID=2635362 RepID=UPI002FD6EBE4